MKCNLLVLNNRERSRLAIHLTMDLLRYSTKSVESKSHSFWSITSKNMKSFNLSHLHPMKSICHLWALNCRQQSVNPLWGLLKVRVIKGRCKLDCSSSRCKVNWRICSCLQHFTLNKKGCILIVVSSFGSLDSSSEVRMAHFEEEKPLAWWEISQWTEASPTDNKVRVVGITVRIAWDALVCKAINRAQKGCCYRLNAEKKERVSDVDEGRIRC